MIEPFTKYLDKFDMITYQAINHSGDQKKNINNDDVNAVTWGVFKAKEVIQPTVVDHKAFVIWKEEAFASWLDNWGIIYGVDSPQFLYL
jgi:methylenetetrahydrofolate reductase (NADPH)